MMFADKDSKASRVRFDDSALQQGGPSAEGGASDGGPLASPTSAFDTKARPRASSLKRSSTPSFEGPGTSGESPVAPLLQGRPRGESTAKASPALSARTGSGDNDSFGNFSAAAASTPSDALDDQMSGRDYTEFFGERVNKNRDAAAADASASGRGDKTGDDEALESWMLSKNEHSLPLLQRITMVPGLDSKFNNLNGRVVFFRPRVFRKSSSGAYVERVLFVVPSGALHLCDRGAIPKRSIALQAVSSFAIHENRIAIIFDSNDVHDIQLRFDAERDVNLASLRQFVSVLRHFSSNASFEKGIVGGLSRLDINLKKPSNYVAPGRIAVLSVPQGEELLGAAGKGSVGLSSDTLSTTTPPQQLPSRHVDAHHRTSFVLPPSGGAGSPGSQADGDDVNFDDEDSDADDVGEPGISRPKFSYKAGDRTVAFRSVASMDTDAFLRDIVEAATPLAGEQTFAEPVVNVREGSQCPATAAHASMPALDLGPSCAAEQPRSCGASQSVPAVPDRPSALPARLSLVHAENRALCEAQQRIETSNRMLADELRRIDETIATIQRETGVDGLNFATDRTASGPDVAQVMIPTAGYQRAIVLSTLICEICKRKRMCDATTPQKELLLSTRRKAKHVYNLI